MTIERPENVDDGIQKEATKSAYRQVRTARKISRKAKIAETFDLTGEQMSVFNSAFAMYLGAKGNREASDLAKRPEYEVMLKIPVFNFVAKQVMQKAEREELTVRILKRSVRNQSTSFITQKDGIGPGRLVNAANYLSTKYLEDSHSFSDQVKASKIFLDRILGN
ncbi:MAG: hypothetical protein ACC618_04880 [Patescibacteria group bacterium]